MSTFRVSIIATDKVFYEGLVNILILPAMDGEAAVMAHHEDMVMAVVAGEMRFQTEDGNWTDVVVGTGFVQMINNRALVLVDTAERPEDIDIVRAREAKGEGTGTASPETESRGVLPYAGVSCKGHVQAEGGQ